MSIFEKPKLQTGAEDGSGEEEDNVTTTLVLENKDKEARKGNKVALNPSDVQSSHNFPKSLVFFTCSSLGSGKGIDSSNISYVPYFVVNNPDSANLYSANTEMSEWLSD